MNATLAMALKAQIQNTLLWKKGWFLRRKKKYELTEGKYQSSGLRKDNKIKKANVDLVAQFDEIGSQAHTHTHTPQVSFQTRQSRDKKIKDHF